MVGAIIMKDICIECGRMFEKEKDDKEMCCELHDENSGVKHEL